MSHDSVFVAVDLGAESGRVIGGVLQHGRLRLEQAYRFANVPVRTPDGLHWDVLRLYGEILRGLHVAAGVYGDAIASVGVDSWGVDYGLIDDGGRLLGLPYHYRDNRTDGVREDVSQRIAACRQYARTGIAQLPFNTLYQLVAQVRAGDRAVEFARTFLMIPDLLHFWLTGVAATEHTNASTTGVLGTDGRWASDLLEDLDLPVRMFMPPSQPGTVLGDVRSAVREECGLRTGRVVLPATHDTASAVIAVPASRCATHSAQVYISSGTWSLLGLELDHPILTEDARLAGFTNEGGIGGTFRFLTNIMGLWLLQECRRAWMEHGQAWAYEELTAWAAATPSPVAIIDVDDPSFLHPEDMPSTIAASMRRTGQAPVDEPGAMVRVILEGIALAYRVGIETAEQLSGMRVGVIHIVGGGSRNRILCQFTADACRRPVLAGPEEATAMGNVLVQALGLGEIGTLAEARDVACRSVDPVVYEPGAAGDWDSRVARLRDLRARRNDHP